MNSRTINIAAHAADAAVWCAAEAADANPDLAADDAGYAADAAARAARVKEKVNE